MVMTLFGGMSKGERSRIRTRVRNAMAAHALRRVGRGSGSPEKGVG
jgi:DNA invertase Pin-like site-specific DNA recombinase